MKLKYCLFFVLIVISCQSSLAQQFSSRMWHSGWLVTIDRDTLRGDIKYDMPSNAVQIMITHQRKKKIFTYSSKKVMFFQIFDVNLNNYRQFYSIPYKIRSDFKAPILFEILYEGPLTMMLRERIVVDSDPLQSQVYGTSSTIERLEYVFYFIDRKGKITMYQGVKNELYEIFVKHQEKVKEYIKKNKLDIDDMQDLVRITAFYNSL